MTKKGHQGRSTRGRPAPPPRPGTRPPQQRSRSRFVRNASVLLSLAAVVVSVALWQSGRGTGGVPAGLPVARASTLGRLSPPPDPGPLGPEDVPVPSGPPLAVTGSLAAGSSIDGISCAPLEQLVYHNHVHLTIFVAGAQRQIPFGVGIAPPLRIQSTPYGPFAAGGACFSWLHTHAADGIIHVESPVQRTYTLGEFFDVWKQPLGLDQVGSATGRVTAFFDGRRYLGNPRNMPLLAHAQIQLDVGTPLVAPESIRFPPGL